MSKIVELYNVIKDKVGEEVAIAIVDTLEDVAQKTKMDAATRADLKDEITKLEERIIRFEGTIKGEFKSFSLQLVLSFLFIIFILIIVAIWY
ncbi:MAG: hypothetical protein L3V56_08960 [Candidatus Magnetoovum sp. WYHC-5]|nr:hypothetical protein [Candidatus Magnetoovum sp. WYHC-5]